MKTGLIGTGTMGTMLATTFIHAGVLSASDISLYNRTPAKAHAIAARHPEMTVVDELSALVERCSLLFICVKPHEYRQVLETIQPHVQPSHIIVSITSPVSIAQLEEALPCKIAKLIPSVTNSVQSGVALYTFGTRLDPHDRQRLLSLLRGLGLPFEISEQHTRIASDMSSCGPAFVSLLLEMWCEAAVARTGIEAQTTRQLLAEMLVGLGQLLTCAGLSTQEVITKVAVPGGITAEGLASLRASCTDVFHRLTALTHEKYERDVAHIDQSFRALLTHDNVD